MNQALDAVFRPRHVAFLGGSNLAPALKYHRELGFAGETWVVNPKYGSLEGFACHARIEDLPVAPDLAFVAIPREAAIEAIDVLRRRGCKAVVCNAAGFSETGVGGVDLQARLVAAAGPMAVLGPNSVGVVNFADPMAAIMDHFGVGNAQQGVAIVSQGGGVLCDAVFCDRGLTITHLVGCGNQALIGIEDCASYLLDDPRVGAIGLSFEGLHDVAALRAAAAKALRLGKPLVAIKFGKTAVGAQAAASHTASMTGAGAAWEALFDRLGIVSTKSESEFFETLKLFASGRMPKGRRALVTCVSGVLGVMLADHLSAAGFELPQPSAERAVVLRGLLPGIATPGNPQDVTMAAWNDRHRQQAVYESLLEEGYDIALMVQNYPRLGMWDVAEYAAQVEALGAACVGRAIAALQLAPMADCFPAEARVHTQRLGLAAMQGLDECIAALGHAVWWRERREALSAAGLEGLTLGGPPTPVGGVRLDEATAKSLLQAAGIPVPHGRVTTPEQAPRAAMQIGFPVAVKALDLRLPHKTEVGAVKLGLDSALAVAEAVETMRVEMARGAPGIPLTRVLVEAMANDVVVEIMASITHDACVGQVMMIARGGIEAELWNDQVLLAGPFSRAEIARALDQLKVARLIRGWRRHPAGDREALLDALEALARLATDSAVEEIEINPILVGRRGVLAVDAVLRLPHPQTAVA